MTMTVELLKTETTKLTKIEKLEVLQFLAQLLSDEAQADALTLEQEKKLRRRKNDIETGKVKTIPAMLVKAKLMKKYGLRT